MIRNRLASLLFSFALLTAAGTSAAVEAIPEACLKCRSASDDASFITCLYDCLGSVKSLKSFGADEAPAVSDGPAETDGARADFPKIEGWVLDEEPGTKEGQKQRTAVRSSGRAFSWFFDIVEPSLVLAKAEKSGVMVVIDFSPAILQGFSDRILVQVDDNKVRAYRPQIVWNNHAVFLDDKALLKEIKAGKRLYVRMEIFGAGTRTVSFDLKGATAACRWLEELDATRS